MLQDLAHGKLDIVYQNLLPTQKDAVICFQGNQVLLHRTADDILLLPSYAEILCWSSAEKWNGWTEDTFRFAFSMQEKNYFLWMGEGGAVTDPEFSYETVRGLRQLQSKEVCFAVMTAWHLFTWYRSNRFCGRCATPTVHDKKERMLLCPECGNMIYPRISPAVIVAVTDGDRLLLSKYAGREYTRYALIAGFMEVGETAEQTVSREVMEEVGLKVKNIRYYKSQPWGVDGNVLLGFFCELDGDDTIRLDTNELSMAQWFSRDEIPAKDDGISLTREMIRVFSEGGQ